MRSRATSRKASAASIAVDLVIIAPRDDELAILLARSDADSRAEYVLPWSGVDDASLDAAAQSIARANGIVSSAALVQVAAIADREAHPGGAQVSVAYLLVTRERIADDANRAWFALSSIPSLLARHREVVAAGVAKLRELAVSYPLAISLLGESFTLGAVQAMYELLLGRPVHKASFRRTLHGSGLVEPVGTWLSERRGRPAQLYRRSVGASAEISTR